MWDSLSKISTTHSMTLKMNQVITFFFTTQMEKKLNQTGRDSWKRLLTKKECLEALRIWNVTKPWLWRTAGGVLQILLDRHRGHSPNVVKQFPPNRTAVSDSKRKDGEPYLIKQLLIWLIRQVRTLKNCSRFVNYFWLRMHLFGEWKVHSATVFSFVGMASAAKFSFQCC